MTRNCCHVSLAFVLKLLNFLQAFLGVSIILYSTWMLYQWTHHVPMSPPPFPAPPPHYSSSSARLSNSLDYGNSVFGFMFGFGFYLDSLGLPAPWFIYSIMGVGILLCCITLIGCMAAESSHGCCLCFYTILKTVLILLEVALVAFIAFDHQWEKDLPFDPTGELDSLRSFIENNVYICKWVGITVSTIQVLSLLLAMVLRGLVSPRRTDLEDEDYENVKGRTREPLPHQASQTSSAGTHSDTWSSRMREKYGLNSGEKSSLLNQNVSVSMKTK